MNATVNLNHLPDYWDLPIALNVPPKFRRGKHRMNQKATIETAVNNLKGIAARMEDGDWANKRILDFGCGVKLAQCLLQFDVAVGEYYGIDNDSELIDWLKFNVEAPNYRFYTVPFHHDSYNPNGRPMTADSMLPGKQDPYDVIVALSVFTHFNPEDFQNALHVLRRYAGENTKFLFTCFIGPARQQEDFVDGLPDVPLIKGVYRQTAVDKMLDEAGWEISVFCHPGFDMQHHYVCVPK